MTIEYFHEVYEEAITTAVHETISGVKKQKIERASAGMIRNIWNDCERLGFVRNQKALDKMCELFIKNIAILSANTMLCGHTQYDPKQYLENIFEDDKSYEKAIEIWDETWYEYFFEISDYATPKLEKLALMLMKAKEDKEKVMYLDLMLNVIHQRSDISEIFIEGGAKTLDFLATSWEQVCETCRMAA